jgi:hypothetical protein
MKDSFNFVPKTIVLRSDTALAFTIAHWPRGMSCCFIDGYRIDDYRIDNYREPVSCPKMIKDS